MLKELPKGKEFTIKLVEPLKAFGEWSYTICGRCFVRCCVFLTMEGVIKFVLVQSWGQSKHKICK